jgi:oligopeptide/dipeptide ABC transporter ATP-binding protein
MTGPLPDRAGQAGAPPLLAVRDLGIGYATEGAEVSLLDRTSFEVGRGEIVCLVGESGSGKTITARAIMGLLRQNRRMRVHGEVLFDGRDLIGATDTELNALRGRSLAMIFQDPVAALDPVMPIGAQIGEAVAKGGAGRAEVRRRVLDLVGRVGLSDPERRVRQYPHEISGGMCQRVALAMALAGEPELLIADEPTTALDVTIQAQVLDLLRQLRQDRQMSVLLITHDMGVAAQIADRILVMYAGSVVEAGTTGQFFERPSHPYSRGLITAVPRIGGERVARLPAIAGSVPEARDRPGGCAFHPRCPMAIDRCLVERPGLGVLGERSVACHRAGEAPDAVPVPLLGGSLVAGSGA